MMGKHALLSASASKRWLSCTPSARLEEQFKDEAGGSVYAEEGTAAHALAEYYPLWEPPVSRFRATRKFLP